MLPKNSRLADEDIYLQEDRFQKPKEIYKLIAERIKRLPGTGTPLDIIDVGCATGELLYHLNQVLETNHKYFGVDVSSAMLKLAKTMVPAAEFSELDLSADTAKFGRLYDVVICCGVLGIFDDLTVPLRNLLKLCKPSSAVMIITDVNDANVDLITRYRQGGGTATWQSGWNIFSRQTIEAIVRAESSNCRVSFHAFVMPFDLPAQPDPMRTWTVDMNGERTRINGAGLILPQNLIEIFT